MGNSHAYPLRTTVILADEGASAADANTRARLAALEQRVAMLEAAPGPGPRAAPRRRPRPRPRPRPGIDGLRRELAARLAQRRAALDGGAV